MEENLVILSGNEQTLRIPFDGSIRGTGAAETVQLTGSATASFGASTGDRVAFAGDISNYTFTQAGNQLIVERADGVRAELAVNGTFTAAFADGSAQVDIGAGSGGVAITVGGQTVGSGFDPSAVSLNGGDSSDIGGTGGGDDGGQNASGVTSSGSAFVIGDDGPQDAITSGDRLVIGRGSDGSVSVDSGQSLTFDDPYEHPLKLGVKQGAKGDLTVSGDNTSVAADGFGSVDVGNAGTGNLTVDNGASLQALYMSAGGAYVPENAISAAAYATGGTGNITIDGQGSEIALSGTGSFGFGPSDTTPYGAFLTVGEEGTGSLSITNGGTLSISSQNGQFPGISVGDGGISESSGSVTIDGQGSSLEIDGGTGTAGDGGYLGWIAIGSSDLGVAGQGDMTVRNGGSVSNDPGGATFVGEGGAGSDGSLTVTGSGSSFQAGDQLFIGAGFNFSSRQPIFGTQSSGTVNVENGATLSAGEGEGDGENDIFVGSNGSLTVSGGGTVTGDVQTGAGGTFMPGNSPGLAIVQGDFTSNGAVTFELDGREAGAFDRIEVAGDATLGGNVTIDVGEGFTPAAGDTFDLVEADGSAALGDDVDVSVDGLADDLGVDLGVTGGSTIRATIVDDSGAIA